MPDMHRQHVIKSLAPLLLGAVLVAGCGSSGSSSASTASTSSRSSSSNAPSSSSTPSPADATSKATGDIPDNQTFLTFRNRSAGYALRYPEGWTTKASGSTVTFRDKENSIRAVVTHGPAPTPSSATASVAALKRREPTLTASGAATSVRYTQGTAIKVSYRYLGPPDAVTGKRLQLLVDRYLYGRAGKVAIVDLATPKGVDNVDAYRMISRSFAWR